MSEITLEELRARLGEDGLVLVDVRTPLEHSGVTCAPCDPRPGRIPGSLGMPLDELFTLDGASIDGAARGSRPRAGWWRTATRGNGRRSRSSCSPGSATTR